MKEIEKHICRNCQESIGFPLNQKTFRFCPYCGKNLYGINKIQLDKGIEETVYNWLSKTLSIDNWLVSETVRNQMATVFLLIWPILETKVFNGDMSHNQMRCVAEYASKMINISKLDDIAFHFFERYQDNRKYMHLAQRQNWNTIERILENQYYELNNYKKTLLMIYIVYRYRNNIFHGIKTIQQWSAFDEEIQRCIEFMVLLGECYDVKRP